MKLQVGVKAIIQNENGLYLLLHRVETMTGETEPHWDIPGGRIESDEPLEKALQREIREETGLTIEATPHLVNAQDIFVPSVGLHVVRLTYVIKGDGNVIISHEHQDTRWVSRAGALGLNLDPYLRATLESLKST